MGTLSEEAKSKEIIKLQEQHLLEDVQHGDKRAFAELVTLYERDVYRICFRFLGNEDDALDAVQEVFIRVYRSIGNFEGRSSLKTWIYRIAANTCITISEKRKKEKEGFLKVILDWWTSHSEPSPEEAVVESETHELNKQVVNEKLMSLPEIYRMPVILKDIEGLPMEKISEILEIPLGTVKSRISRGRAVLHDLLRSYCKVD